MNGVEKEVEKIGKTAAKCETKFNKEKKKEAKKSCRRMRCWMLSWRHKQWCLRRRIDTHKVSITTKSTEITTLNEQVEFFKKEIDAYHGKEAKFDRIVTLQKNQKHK